MRHPSAQAVDAFNGPNPFGRCQPPGGCDSIGRSMDAPRIVVTKSTVPVGTADKVAEAIRAEQQARGVEIPF